MPSTPARRRSDRDRKRAERQARRDAGLPDPALLNRLMVDALRDSVYRRRDTSALDAVVWSHVALKDVFKRARAELRRRGHTKEASNAAIMQRFMAASASDTLPAVKHPLQTKTGQADTAAQRPMFWITEVLVPTETPSSGQDVDIQTILDDLLWSREPPDA